MAHILNILKYNSKVVEHEANYHEWLFLEAWV